MNVILLGLVSFITDVSSEMIHPLLPEFIRVLGGTALIVSLVGSLGDFVQNVLKAPSGYLSDRVGRRKALAAAGYAISATSKLFMPFATLPQIMVLRASERAGKGVRTAPRDALIAESGGKRGRAFGIHRALDTLGAIIGSSLAFAFLLLAGWGIKEVMICGAIIAFLALIPFVFVKEVARRPGEPSRWRRPDLPSDLKRFIVASSLFGLSNITYMLFLLFALMFVEPPFGLSHLAFATALYVLFNVFYAGLSLPSGVLSDKIGRKKVISLGYLVFALTCLLFSVRELSASVPILVGLFSLYGTSKALIDGTQRAYASDLAPEEGKGYALGVFHTATGLANLACGFIAGYLWLLLGPTWTFVYASVLSAISAVLLMALCR